ncbi:universal stress protein [Aquabacter spiritensis]|uniref:Nucleotide-binding universal stress UspA family protein n=1 Tax=Aquabacter spiritensis TaxID=933073 RepID=A0A4V2UYL5_9HYPH|nr:universal stress protein [Aquabacter spiritensis]TCT07898.1 nucleotide-binding universal stress UspA family protein [Aquabacter spiritensis]
MIKHIVVVVDGVGRAAEPMAFALAEQYGARVTALCIVVGAPLGFFVQPPDRLDLATADRRDALTKAQDLAEGIERRARAAGLQASSVVICREDPVGDEGVTEVIRACDLIVVEQPDPDGVRPADMHLETLLVESGRPCLLVPYAGKPASRFRAIIVAWDGGVSAARALADAMPFLHRAARVEIVQVATGFLPEGARIEARLVEHLGAHGVSATFRTLVRTDPFGEVILSHAADTETDLLVMGAYGHSPLREALLGGATRDILSAMTVPVLLSH